MDNSEFLVYIHIKQQLGKQTVLKCHYMHFCIFLEHNKCIFYFFNSIKKKSSKILKVAKGNFGNLVL